MLRAKYRAVKYCLSVEKGEYLGIIGPNGGENQPCSKQLSDWLPLGKYQHLRRTLGKRSVSIGYVPQIASMENNFQSPFGRLC